MSGVVFRIAEEHLAEFRLAKVFCLAFAASNYDLILSCSSKISCFDAGVQNQTQSLAP